MIKQPRKALKKGFIVRHRSEIESAHLSQVLKYLRLLRQGHDWHLPSNRHLHRLRRAILAQRILKIHRYRSHQRA